MATATKKSAAKKPAVKKSAAKKAKVVAKKANAPAAKRDATKFGYKINYKAGDRVKVTKRDDTIEKGRVVRIEHKHTGAFIVVKINTGTEKEPVYREISARPAKVKGF